MSRTKNDVLDLAAASKFLNISEPMLTILAEQGRVPARKFKRVGWRFSVARLEKWMRDEIDPTIALLQQVGTCKDDPDLMPMLADIYKARGRPECEEDDVSANGTKNGRLDLAAASKLVNIREHVLATLAEQGRVPARKVGKHWRFNRARLEKWMEADADPTIALLRLAGVWKDDPDIKGILEDIRARDVAARQEE